MVYKCLCCPCDILGQAEYWFHLVSYHNLDREIAKTFVIKRKLIKAIADCPVPFMCRECALPLTDLLHTRMPETHFDNKTLNIEQNQNIEENAAMSYSLDETNLSGIYREGSQGVESPARQSSKIVSESLCELDDDRVSKDVSTSINWLDTDIMNQDKELMDRSGDHAGLVPLLPVKQEINETVDNEIFNEMEDVFTKAINKTFQGRPQNTMPKWNKNLPRRLAKTWDANTICEKEGLKFKVELIENSTTYVCLDCPLKTRTWRVLVEHSEKVHGAVPNAEVRPHLCAKCAQRFFHNSELKKHMEIKHAQEKLKCEYCSYATVYRIQLKNHIKQVHLHSGKHKCKVTNCGKSFVHPKNLERHMTVHSGERKHICVHCGKTFKTSSNLSQHLNTHQPKTLFTCHKCLKTFNFKQNFNIHVNKCNE